MGLQIRKTIKLGPLNINLSRSGISFSFGTKGIRLGKDSKGRSYSHLSIPKTGIYSRSYKKRVKLKKN